jgi:hypothetical protein
MSPITSLQLRKKDAGRVTRVPAVQLERLIVEAIRAKVQPETEPKGDPSDRAIVDRHVARIIARPDSIDIELREPTAAPAPSPTAEAPVTAGLETSSTCTTAPAFHSVKGVLHQPEAKPTLKQETRDAILLAIAKARSWIDDLVSGPHSIIRRDRRTRRQGGEAHSPSDAACVHPATHISCDNRRDPPARCHRDGACAGDAISMGAQSCRPNLRASARRRPLMVVRGS